MTRLAFPAESDPDFREKALQQLDKRKKVVVYCGRGGTLRVGNGNERKYNKDDPERMFGIETRSLKACYELLEVWRHSQQHSVSSLCFSCIWEVPCGVRLWRQAQVRHN